VKVVSINDVKSKLGDYCKQAQEQTVLITKRGRPLAVVIGVAGHDLEDLLTASDPSFWRLIEERRRQRTISNSEMRRRLARRDSPSRGPGK
jgi:prevent-host-death family protein